MQDSAGSWNCSPSLYLPLNTGQKALQGLVNPVHTTEAHSLQQLPQAPVVCVSCTGLCEQSGALLRIDRTRQEYSPRGRFLGKKTVRVNIRHQSTTRFHLESPQRSIGRFLGTRLPSPGFGLGFGLGLGYGSAQARFPPLSRVRPSFLPDRYRGRSAGSRS